MADPQAAVKAVQAGEADIHVFAQPTLKPTVDAISGLHFNPGVSAEYEALSPNLGKAPWSRAGRLGSAGLASGARTQNRLRRSEPLPSLRPAAHRRTPRCERLDRAWGAASCRGLLPNSLNRSVSRCATTGVPPSTPMERLRMRRHPYTRSLLAAVPRDRGRLPTPLGGGPPSPLRDWSGCVFRAALSGRARRVLVRTRPRRRCRLSPGDVVTGRLPDRRRPSRVRSTAWSSHPRRRCHGRPCGARRNRSCPRTRGERRHLWAKWGREIDPVAPCCRARTAHW